MNAIDSYAHAFAAAVAGFGRGVEDAAASAAALQTGPGVPMTAVAKKRCKRCLAEKPAGAFHKHHASDDGLQTWCKRCLLRQQRLARAERIVAKAVARKAEILARVERGKACGHCGLVKPLEEFIVDRRKADGHGSTCKACVAPARRQAWANYRAKRAVAGSAELFKRSPDREAQTSASVSAPHPQVARSGPNQGTGGAT